MNPIISCAIREKRLLHLSCHGSVRLVEPYAYGRDGYGDESLFCFQLEGGSRSGRPTGWKFLTVTELAEVYMLEKRMAVMRSDYIRSHRSFRTIYVQL